MQAWIDTLKRFSAHIQSPACNASADLHCPHYEIARGIGVYRNNYRGNLHDTLAAAYPVIVQLVGADFFRLLAARFIANYPSRNGNLHHYGSEMADFLEHFEPAAGLVYLSDMARVEWAYHRACMADDDPVFDLQRLAEVPATAYPMLGWSLHSSCTVLSTRYPVAAIWRMHQQDLPAEMRMDLAGGGDHLLIHRQALQSQILNISAADGHCLQLLHSGRALGDAVDTTLTAYPEFDLMRSLRHWLALGIMTDFEILPA